MTKAQPGLFHARRLLAGLRWRGIKVRVDDGKILIVKGKDHASAHDQRVDFRRLELSHRRRTHFPVFDHGIIAFVRRQAVCHPTAPGPEIYFHDTDVWSRFVVTFLSIKVSGF